MLALSRVQNLIINVNVEEIDQTENDSKSFIVFDFRIWNVFSCEIVVVIHSYVKRIKQ
jgi:hypothetical protein